MMGKYETPPYYGTLRETRKEEDKRIAAEVRLSQKWVEDGMN
jgi:hypothetical protein